MLCTAPMIGAAAPAGPQWHGALQQQASWAHGLLAPAHPGSSFSAAHIGAPALQPPRPAPRQAHARRRGCQHCVCCHTARGTLPSPSAPGDEPTDLWPGGLPSPTIYYALRARQLEHQYRHPSREVKQWRATQETQSDPSDLLTARRRRPLLLAVPTACTNVAQNDTRIQYVSTHSVALKPRPAAASAPAPAAAAAAPQLQRTLSGARRGPCPEAPAAAADPKRSRLALTPLLPLASSAPTSGAERGHLVMPAAPAGAAGASGLSVSPQRGAAQRATPLATPPPGACRAPLSASGYGSGSSPADASGLWSGRTSASGGSGLCGSGPSMPSARLASRAASDLSMPSARSFMSTPGGEAALLSSLLSSPAGGAAQEGGASPPRALLPLHRAELAAAAAAAAQYAPQQYAPQQGQQQQQQYAPQYGAHQQQQEQPDAGQLARYYQRQYRIKAEQAYACHAVVELTGEQRHSTHSAHSAEGGDAQPQLSVTAAWALLRSLAGSISRRVSPKAAAQ